MELIGLHDGQPGQHLGVSHMLKHYLSPAEVWEDLVPAEVHCRPWALLDGFGDLDPPPWEQWKNPGEALTGRWSRELVPAYREGYLAVVRSLAEPMPEVRTGGWRPCGYQRWVHSTPEGVVLVVVEERWGAGLRTAFRALGMTLKSHRSVPMSEPNRALRSVIARQKASRIVTLIAAGGRR